MENIDLSQAYRLPAIHVTEMEVDQMENTVAGSFTLYNGEQETIGGLQYNVEVLDQAEQLFARTAVRTPFTLAGKETREVPFAYTLPSLPEGSYLLRIQVTTAEGRYLGWQDRLVSGSGMSSGFAMLTAKSIFLSEFAGEELEPLTGPNVSPKGEITLQATVKNTGDQPLAVMPVVETYVFDMSRGEGVSENFAPLTLGANEERTLDITINASEKPEVYSALLSLRDPETGRILSSLAEYRYVVRGADADLLLARVEQFGTKEGDQTVVRVDVVGAPDAETKMQGTVTMDLLDEKGVVGQVTVPNFALSDAISSGTAGITLTRSLVGEPSLRVTIADAEGKILAERTVAYTLTEKQLNANKTPARAMNAALILMGIVLITFLLIQITARLYRGLPLRIAPLLARSFLIAYLVVGAGTVEAAGNGNGIEVLAPPWSAQFNNPALVLFINAPIHNAPAGTYQKNAVPLQYRVTFGVCHNRVSYVRVLGRIDKSGGKQSTLYGDGTVQWELVHDQLLQAGPLCPNSVPYCLFDRDFTGSLDLSAHLPASVCSTTLQLVAKLGQDSNGPVGPNHPGLPDQTISPTDNSFKANQVHAVNLWLNFACGGDVTIQKTGPASVVRGSNLSYAITVQNAGPGMANNVVMTDPVPAGLTFQQAGSDPACSLQGSNVVCAVGSLNANQSRTLSLAFTTPAIEACVPMNVQNSAVVSADADLNQANNQSQTVLTTVDCPPPPPPPPPPQVGCIDITKSALDSSGSPLQVAPQVTVSLDNQRTALIQGGKARFDNVTPGQHTISEVIPDGWTQQSITPTGGSVQVASGTSCANVTIVNKQNPVTAQVGCIEVRKELYDEDNNRISDASGFTFRVPSGQTATTNNDGSARLENVPVGSQTVTELERSGYRLDSMSPSNGSVNVVAGLTCVQLTVKNIKEEDKDPADVTITKEANPQEVFPGGSIEYTLTITNDGEEDAHDVVVTDRFSKNQVSVIDDGDADDEEDDKLIWELGTLKAGDSETIRYILLSANLPVGDSIRNVAKVTFDGGSDEDEAIVHVIGDLPQTGVADLLGPTATLRKWKGGSKNDQGGGSTLPFAALLSTLGIAAGAGMGMRKKVW